MSRRCINVLLSVALLFGAGCQMSPAHRIQRAHEALYRKDPQRALKEYRLALDVLDQDRSPGANVLRAQALRGSADLYYLELKQIQEARRVYQELIRECPEAPETLEARINLADILRVYHHDVRGAIGELTAALARNPPQGAELTYEVAKLYFELGDYAQCGLEAEKLADKFQTSPYVDDALFLAAQALGMREGMHPEASKAYHALLERFPESELAPHALFELGKLKAEQGDNDAAITLWVAALKTHPDPTLVQQSIARVRRRITNTTPGGLGKEAAFAGDKKVASRPTSKRTSVEAAGGTAEEAARDNGD